MPIAMATGPGWSTPTSTVSSFRAPTLSSSRRATSAEAPFSASLATVSSVAFRMRSRRFSPRASGTIRLSQSSSLIFRSCVPEIPADAGSTIARARAPASRRPG